MRDIILEYFGWSRRRRGARGSGGLKTFIAYHLLYASRGSWLASGLSASDIVRLFEEDRAARRRLAELLVMDEDVRLAIINAVLRDVATKSDIERLRDELRGEFRAEIGRLDSRIDRLEARLEGVERELSALRERVARVEGALTQMAERIGDLDKRIDALDKLIDSLDKRIHALDRRIDELGKRMDYIARITMILTGSVIATLIAAIILGLLGG